MQQACLPDNENRLDVYDNLVATGFGTSEKKVKTTDVLKKTGILTQKTANKATLDTIMLDVKVDSWICHLDVVGPLQTEGFHNIDTKSKYHYYLF